MACGSRLSGPDDCWLDTGCMGCTWGRGGVDLDPYFGRFVREWIRGEREVDSGDLELRGYEEGEKMKRLTEGEMVDLDSLLMCLANVEGVSKGVVAIWKKALKSVLDGQKQPLTVGPEMMQKCLPLVRKKGESVNVVLALWSRKIYDDTNQYIPRWTVCNAEYYQKNSEDFEGWIALKDMDTKPLFKGGKGRTRE